MKANTTQVEALQPPAAIEEVAGDLLAQWIDRCDDFMDRQRQNIIEREPSPHRLAEHLDALKFMIRVTLFLQALLADPDFRLRQAVPNLTGKLLQLQESLKLLQNPMTDAEADAILQAAFPDGGPAGGANELYREMGQ